jgi:hypothetical protein
MIKAQWCVKKFYFAIQERPSLCWLPPPTMTVLVLTFRKKQRHFAPLKGTVGAVMEFAAFRFALDLVSLEGAPLLRSSCRLDHRSSADPAASAAQLAQPTKAGTFESGPITKEQRRQSTGTARSTAWPIQSTATTTLEKPLIRRVLPDIGGIPLFGCIGMMFMPHQLLLLRNFASWRSILNPIDNFDQAGYHRSVSLPLPATAQQIQQAEAASGRWQAHPPSSEFGSELVVLLNQGSEIRKTKRKAHQKQNRHEEPIVAKVTPATRSRLLAKARILFRLVMAFTMGKRSA